MIDEGLSNDTSWLYKAEEELRRALQDDPHSAWAHTALAAVYLYQGRKELIPAEVDKARKASPKDINSVHWLAHYHRLKDEYDAAISLWRQCLEAEPLFWPGRMCLGDILRQQGDLAGAIREEEKILEHIPQNVYAIRYLARTHMTAGDLPSARRTLGRLRPEDRKNYEVRIAWGVLLALEGKREEALQEVDEGLLKFGVAHVMDTLEFAEFYALLGDAPQALDWLDRAVRNGDERVEWFRRNPLLANLREQPRFRQILESIAYRRRQ
jgi:Tfp pilus assembly protein PilF